MKLPNTGSAAPVPTAMDLFMVLRRRIVYAVIPAFLIASAFAAYAYTSKARFRSRALIAAEGNQDSSQGAEPASRVQDRLRMVREILFNDSNFQSVVQQFDLMKTTTTKDAMRATDEIKSRVKIEVDGEDAFYIGYEGGDRRQVTDVANRFADILVQQTSNKHEHRNEQESSLIDSEVDRIHSRLTDLESQIQKYKQGAVEELPERLEANFKQLAVLQEQIQSKTGSISNDEARRVGLLAQIGDLDKLDKEAPAPEPPPPPEVKSDNQLKLDAARQELAKFRGRGYTDIHPEVIRVQGEIRDLQNLVAAEPKRAAPVIPVKPVSQAQLKKSDLKAELETIDRRLTSTKQEKAALVQQLNGYQVRIDSSPRHEQVLGQLTRDYDIAKGQYETELQKQLEVRRTQQLDKLNNGLVFRIVEPARIPLDPYSPNRLRLLALGLVAGIGTGLGAVVLVEHVDSSFKDVDEFQAQTGLQVLSIIPRLLVSRAVRKPNRKSRSSGLLDASLNGISGFDPNPVDTIVTIHDTSSVATEQYQILAMRLKQRATDSPRLLLVTSSTGGEGKTVTSVNLAIALAGETHSKVLLMDADLRRPRVHEYLGLAVASGRGLGDLIANPDDDFSGYIRKVGPLSVLPGGTDVGNPLELLSSQKLCRLMARIREQFDYMVIDSPPVIPIADGLILSRLADEVVFVVRACRTPREVLRRALDSLDRSKLAGVVLNDVDTKHSRYAYAYRYYQNTYLGRT